MEKGAPVLVALLGAGASAAADVPTTKPFVEAFLDETSPVVELKNLIENLRHRDPEADLETLLRVLHSLGREDSSPETMFLARPSDLPSAKTCSDWASSLEDFVRAKCFVKVEKIHYLDHLRGLIANYARPLDIFTVNYDTTIEVFCVTRSIQFNNGFRGTWKPEVFEEEDTDVRLYKIHGSVTWWSTEQGAIVEIPVALRDRTTPLYYGAVARTLVIYPGDSSKVVVRPTLDLLSLLRRRLSKADIFLCAGYSFRDEEIRGIVLDAIRDNRNLLVVLLGPSAFERYHARLKHSAPGVLSAASGRVACLPFAFERVLPVLEHEHLRAARDGWGRFNNLVAAEVQYGATQPPAQWAYVCDSLVKGGFLETASEVLDQREPWKWPLDYHLKATVHLAAIAALANAGNVWADTATHHLHALSERLEIAAKVEPAAGQYLELRFRSQPNEGLRPSTELSKWLSDIGAEIEAWGGRARGVSANFTSIVKLLREALKYLEENWHTGKAIGWQVGRWQPQLGGLFANKDDSQVWAEIGAEPETAARVSRAEGSLFGSCFHLQPPVFGPSR